MRRTTALCLVFSVLSALVLSGCGTKTKTVPVNGKVILPSQLKLADTDSLQIQFISDEGRPDGAIGDISVKDLTFSTNVPVGKYKVAVKAQPYPGDKNSDQHGKELNNSVGKYNASSTSLRYDVTEGSHTITVDLAKGTITK